MKSTIWAFESAGRSLSIKRDSEDQYWITGSGIGDVYVPLLTMLSSMHGKRKTGELERKLKLLRTEEDVEAYLKAELGGRLGFRLVTRYCEEETDGDN